MTYNFTKNPNKIMKKILNDIKQDIYNKKYESVYYNIKNGTAFNKTNLDSVSGAVLKKVPIDDNVYFIFDSNNKMRYIGKKQNGEGINYRLKLHLIVNKTKKTASCIDKVIEEIKSGANEFRYITIKVMPEYMAPAVESFLIDYYKNLKIPECDFVKRK